VKRGGKELLLTLHGFIVVNHPATSIPGNSITPLLTRVDTDCETGWGTQVRIATVPVPVKTCQCILSDLATMCVTLLLSVVHCLVGDMGSNNVAITNIVLVISES